MPTVTQRRRTSKRQPRQGIFRLRVSGTSMEPTFKDGSLVEFKWLAPGENVIAGRDYFVRRDNGEATFRRLESAKAGKMTFRALSRSKHSQPARVATRQVAEMAIATAVIIPVSGESGELPKAE